MSTSTLQPHGTAAEPRDYGLPGNDLNPNTPTPEERKKIPLVIKVYGLLCTVDGIVTAPVLLLFMFLWGWALITDPASSSVSRDPSLTVIVFAIGGPSSPSPTPSRLWRLASRCCATTAGTPGSSRTCSSSPPS